MRLKTVWSLSIVGLNSRRDVIDGDKYGCKEHTDTKAEEHNHEGLNKVDERVDCIRHLAIIEFGKRFKDRT